MNITKDKIKQLTPEQQEAIGSVVLKRESRRQRLLKLGGHYPGMAWLPPLVISAWAFLLPMITNPKYGQIVIFCVGFSLWFLIYFHAVFINRRIDALIELMEEDQAD